MPDGNGVLIATETFAANVDGNEVIIHKNITRVREGHPVALANPDFFQPVEERIDHELPDVEQATAAPGEKRGSRAKPKADKAPEPAATEPAPAAEAEAEAEAEKKG